MTLPEFLDNLDKPRYLLGLMLVVMGIYAPYYLISDVEDGGIKASILIIFGFTVSVGIILMIVSAGCYFTTQTGDEDKK